MPANDAHKFDVWTPSALKPHAAKSLVIAQVGQSLDGQIATATGHSKYINGAGGLKHLHTLRAWADVVIVGVGSVVADNPKLTVRLVEGQHPMRVILDPNGRIPVDSGLLTDRAARTVVMTAEQTTELRLPPHIEVVPIGPDPRMPFSLNAVLQWLKQADCHRVLVEGGPATIARFLATDNIDYLHLLTSAVLLGSGKPGVVRPALDRLAQAKHFRVKAYRLDEDLLLECDLRARASMVDNA